MRACWGVGAGIFLMAEGVRCRDMGGSGFGRKVSLPQGESRLACRIGAVANWRKGYGGLGLEGMVVSEMMGFAMI